ncbi:MAG: hypothetical protein ACE5E8_11120, partial [Acidimicrobiia bacterium]
MATTGILRAANVVFYHPLDNFVESAVGQTWTGTAAFATGKIPLSSPLGVSGATGSSFSFGSIKTVSAVTNTTDTFTVAASIDSTRALLWYRAAPSTMGLRVATVSGTDITLGAETTVASLDTHGSYSLTKLTAAKFVASAILGFGTVTNAVVATVSGTAVTVGAKTPVRSAVGGSTTWPGGSVVALTSSTVLATWSFTNQSSNAIAQAAIGTVSGSDITFGATKDLFTSASVVFSDNVAVALSSTTVVSAFMRAGPKNLVSVVITVSGSDITVGSLNTVETTNSQFFKFGICALDSTRIAVSSADASGVGRVRVGSVSGTTISYGSSVGLIPDIGVGIATQPHCYKLDTDKIIVCSRHANTVSASVEVFTVSGLALTSQGNSLFDGLGGVGRDVTAAIMSTSKVVFGTGNTVGTTAAVGELGLAAGLTAPTPAAYPSTIGDTRVVICFWARNATAGTTSLDIERGYKATLDATSISL